MISQFTPDKLCLQFQMALLDNVTPNLRGVTVGWNAKSKEIYSIFLYDGEITEDMIEDVSCIETEIIAHYYDDFTISVNIERYDYPAPLAGKHLNVWVYYRKEA